MGTISSPPSLYQLCLQPTANNYLRCRQAMLSSPDSIIFDIFYLGYSSDSTQSTNSTPLLQDLANFFVFVKLLRSGNRRSRLHQIVQRGIEQEPELATAIAESFVDYCDAVLHDSASNNSNSSNNSFYNSNSSNSFHNSSSSNSFHNSSSSRSFHNSSSSSWSTTSKLIETGLNFGAFLCEAASYTPATLVLRHCLSLSQSCSGSDLLVRMEILMRLLRSLTGFCQFQEATEVYNELHNLVWRSACPLPPALLCTVYNEFSAFGFVRSQYQEAYNWALKSLKIVATCSSGSTSSSGNFCTAGGNNSSATCSAGGKSGGSACVSRGDVPSKVIIDVLRQASRTCVVKREFVKAEMLAKQAVCLARDVYGQHHAKYADCLMDFGFYLLNIDCLGPSMQVYKTALEVRLEYFGGKNLEVAVAHEDLAYATYVYEYNSGNFQEARAHADESLRIASSLLPSNHLLLGSAKRVLALILEEIAIDTPQDPECRDQLLQQAKQLHLFALGRALANFGERNVLTAKHYGNLGRLYQTMQRFEEAEKMHLKAILIKETILGVDDYEVALSVGHLASLYNYDMKEYSKAELLYLRSIRIGRKLFGPSYSGLEYDYRGLIQVYHNTGSYEKLEEFSSTLQDWSRLRDEKEKSKESCEMPQLQCSLPLSELVRTVASLPDLASSSPPAAGVDSCHSCHPPAEAAVDSCNSCHRPKEAAVVDSCHFPAGNSCHCPTAAVAAVSCHCTASAAVANRYESVKTEKLNDI